MNEPGWNLEILAGGRIVLVTDYGASQVEQPLPQPTVDSDARTTRWEAGDLVVEVIRRPCRDSMSGESFESTVMVTWGGADTPGMWAGFALKIETRGWDSSSQAGTYTANPLLKGNQSVDQSAAVGQAVGGARRRSQRATGKLKRLLHEPNVAYILDDCRV